MNIHFEVGHPAHVHLFKHAITELRDRGHETLVTARDKEVTTDLLDAYDIDYRVLSEQGETTPRLLLEWTLRELKLVRAIRRFDSDVVVSHISPVAAQAARLTGTPSVVFTDDGNLGELPGHANHLATIILVVSALEVDKLSFSTPRERGSHLDPEPEFDAVRIRYRNSLFGLRHRVLAPRETLSERPEGVTVGHDDLEPV